MNYRFTADLENPIVAPDDDAFIDAWRRRSHTTAKTTSAFCAQQATVMATWYLPCISGQVKLDPSSPTTFVRSLVEAGALKID